MDMGLRGKAVLVTGGGRGLGREIALAFAREGADVAICGRTREPLDRTAREITALGAKAIPLVGDLFLAADCQRVVDETAEQFGRLDVLVNNASTNPTYPGRLELASDELVMERVNGKALATIRCSRAALRHLRAAGGGRIVCIGGIGAREVTSPTAGRGMISGLGNALIVNFAKNLSAEVARDGIVVNVVHPATVRTDRFPARIEARARAAAVTVAQAEASLAESIPIGRVTEPSDIAPLVVFLSSSYAGAITGQSIAVDGGDSRLVVY